MKLRNLFIVNAVLALVFGAWLVLAPASLVSLYGGTLSEAGILVARLCGAAFLGICVLTWSARNATDSDVRRAIVLAYFIANAIGFVVALLGQLAGVPNALGWSIVAIYLLLALGYGYFQFLKSSAS